MYQTDNFTYGAEHEWADHPLDRDLPEGYGRDVKDITIVNSNGIANDPKGVTYRYGGEINTPPTDTIDGQVACLAELREHLPEATINYRSNLHLHVRVPGLRDDLVALKRLQKFIHEAMPVAFPTIQPLPRPEGEKGDPEHEGALRRWRRRRVSHQTLLTEKRLAGQLAARMLDEFFALEVPQSRKGTPLWHCQPRLCVNIRQLHETDTIEFRHFAGTMDGDILRNGLQWCTDFLHAGLTDTKIEDVLASFSTEDFPPWPEYCHWQEQRYRATCHDHTLSVAEIKRNIELILKGEFDDVA